MPGKSLDAFPEEKFPALKKTHFFKQKNAARRYFNKRYLPQVALPQQPELPCRCRLIVFIHRQRHGGRPLSRRTCGMNGLPVCSSGL